MSWIVQMFGWLSADAALASRLKRSSVAGRVLNLAAGISKLWRGPGEYPRPCTPRPSHRRQVFPECGNARRSARGVSGNPPFGAHLRLRSAGESTNVITNVIQRQWLLESYKTKSIHPRRNLPPIPVPGYHGPKYVDSESPSRAGRSGLRG